MAVEPGREPHIDLANIFINSDNETINHNTNVKTLPKKRRNTIQPIITHIS